MSGGRYNEADGEYSSALGEEGILETDAWGTYPDGP